LYLRLADTFGKIIARVTIATRIQSREPEDLRVTIVSRCVYKNVYVVDRGILCCRMTEDSTHRHFKGTGEAASEGVF
jgi:hypothetical protein